MEQLPPGSLLVIVQGRKENEILNVRTQLLSKTDIHHFHPPSLRRSKSKVTLCFRGVIERKLNMCLQADWSICEQLMNTIQRTHSSPSQESCPGAERAAPSAASAGCAERAPDGARPRQRLPLVPPSAPQGPPPPPSLSRRPRPPPAPPGSGQSGRSSAQRADGPGWGSAGPGLKPRTEVVGEAAGGFLPLVPSHTRLFRGSAPPAG
ncbi:myelin-associated oligodendrocyte basic protein-like [Sorex araneus]|uniref:myelin-associated oligodendrocyte basic protein-like n=1 Tax=Sorex araneus TaxID=42254 RepID=UPI0024334716|nr:myelin-associated oligodendrocyte basic protein-like [Sorex araneus]